MNSSRRRFSVSGFETFAPQGRTALIPRVIGLGLVRIDEREARAPRMPGLFRRSPTRSGRRRFRSEVRRAADALGLVNPTR